MYDQFYGLNYDPFRLTPSGRDVYAHPSFERARAYLEYGLMRGEGFVVVTGPPGSGKTTLVRELLARLPSGTRYAQIETSRLEADDLLRLVISRFNITSEQRDKASVIEALRGDLLRHARAGGRSLLIVDEAQDLAVDSLEELRLLTNLVEDDQPLLQIVLLGQPGLRDLIRRPELEQFHQRTVASCRLKPLDEEQSIEFVRFRLKRAGWTGNPLLTTAALRLLHTGAEGIPRRLNLLASRLFLHGFAESRSELTLDDAVGVLEEMEDESVGNWHPRVGELRLAENQERRQRPAPAAAATTADDETDEQAAQPVPDDTPAAAPLPSGEPPRADAVTASPATAPSEPADDVIIPPAGKQAPKRGPSPMRQPPPAGWSAQRPRQAARMRTVVVFASVGIAALAIALVVVAATPIGDSMEARVHDWFESLNITGAMGITEPDDTTAGSSR